MNQILDYLFHGVGLINLGFVVYLFFSMRKKVKLSDYVEELPAAYREAKYRVSDLSEQQNVKSAVSSLGLKVGPGKTKKFKITGKF